MIENLPEAPASANFVVDLKTKTVTSIQFTLRDSSEQALMDRVRQLMKDVGVKTAASEVPQESYPPAASQPPVARTGVPVNAEENSETWDRPTVEVKYMGDQRALAVKGGNWKKYGAVAWPENVPFEGWEEWPIGQPFLMPAPYTKAIVQMKDKDGKLVPDRVLRFE